MSCMEAISSYAGCEKAKELLLFYSTDLFASLTIIIFF